MGKGILMLKKVGLLCLFLLFFSSCREGQPRLYYLEEIDLEKNSILKEKEEEPYIGVIKDNYLIQPTPGTYTKVKPKSYYEAQIICDEDGIKFWSRGKLEKYGKKLKVYRVRDEKLVWEQNFFEHSFVPFKLPENELYVLRIILTQDSKELMYDFPFYYLSTSAYKDNIGRVVKSVTSHIRSGENQVGTVAVEIKKASPDGSIEGRAKVVVSTKGEAGKEYLDKIYHFQVHTNGGSKWEETIYNKKRGNYDKNRKGIPFMESGEWYERQGRFIQILDREVYALEGKTMYSLFRRDRIDDDFLMDEISHMEFQNIGWLDDSYYFIAYGNMGEEAAKYQNYRGMTILEWNGEVLQPILFTEIEVANIKEHVNRHLVIRIEEGKVYWLQQGVYYQIDLKNKSVYRAEAPYISQYNKELLVYYWQTQEDKKNQYIYWNDVTTQKIYGVMKDEVYQQILNVNAEGIYVGEYHIENTVEYLNRSTEYGYDKIVLYSPSGTKLKEYNPPKDLFFGNPVWSSDGTALVSVLEKRKDRDSFRLQKTMQQSLEISVRPSTVNRRRELPGNRVSFLSDKMRLISGAVQEKKIGNEKIIFMSLEDEPEINYFLVKGRGITHVAANLGSALNYAKEQPVYEIYNFGLFEEVKVYDSRSKKPSHRVENFIVEKLSSALPNGQAVTALSMLLRYYSPKVAGQLPLAYELTELSKRNSQGNGLANDMHEAFVGNLYEETPDQVTGVYVEPLTSVAKKKVGVKAQDISGSTLNQIMTFVSADKPVLVIVGKNLSVPSEIDREIWKTSNGYAEVSAMLRSVVVIGFDTTFIYYADPETGQVEKGIRRLFEQSYQSFGRQAMVILD